MDTIKRYAVRKVFADRSAQSLLSLPASSLIGVSEAATATLAEVGIKTVQDLAASQIFDASRKLTGARSGLPTIDEVISGDVLDGSVIVKSPRDIAALPIEKLKLVTPSEAASIKSALDLGSVGELALWPPYATARQILADAYGHGSTLIDDPERPDDLVPISRRYATERVQYDIIVMDKLLDEPANFAETTGVSFPTPSRTSLTAAGGIDIADVVSATLSARPAIGAVLTYRQSWYPQGLALGHLLHSMALAPGESTRIAMVDWTRTVRGRTDEDTTQAEALAASVGRTRAMSEVTKSVAKEAQSGFSGSKSEANQKQNAETSGEASAGFTQPGVFGAIDQALFGGKGARATTESRGTSMAESTAKTEATGWASSSGNREINSEMTQNINDQTHQAANSVRNRRATTITETSQKESETLTTRVVTNYNHMHALTIQYYEVVQIYRTSTELTKFSRCLFIPMKLVRFTWEVLRRFKDVIASAGLIPDVMALKWLQTDQLLIAAPGAVDTWARVDARSVAIAIGDEVVAGFGSAVLPLKGLTFVGFMMGDERRFRDLFEKVTIVFNDGAIKEFSIAQQNPAGVYGPLGFVFPEPERLKMDLSDIMAVQLHRRPDKISEEGEHFVGIGFDYYGADGRPLSASNILDLTVFRLGLPIRIVKGEKITTALTFARSIAGADVISHLEQNALHYSTAIWRSLDSATITTMLSRYDFEGRPLIELIDPIPISLSGNYLIFRFYHESAEWNSFIAHHKLDRAETVEDLVPLPSGGVFAEAVLGRSNAAEKLDITRFWNWQDSPIPILPPEINPLVAGGKDNPPSTGTQPLESSVLNIVNPPSLPDPAGLAPLYAAIANGNIFRDMSGMAQTAALAQAALQAAQAGAGQATTAAGQAQQVAAQQLTEFMKLATQVALAAATLGVGGVSGATGAAGGAGRQKGVDRSPSNAGAMINQGSKMDAKEAGRQNGASSPSEPPSATDSAGQPDSTVDVEANGLGSNPTSNEGQAFATMLDGSAGTGGTSVGGGVGNFIETAIKQMVTGAAPVGVGPAVKKGLATLTGKVVDKTIDSSSRGDVDFQGIKVAHILLEDFDNARDYIKIGPLQYMWIKFPNLGGNFALDGLKGSVKVQWEPAILNPDKLLRTKYSKDVVAQINNTTFFKNISIASGGLEAGSALSKALVKCDLGAREKDLRVIEIGSSGQSIISPFLLLTVNLTPITGITGNAFMAEVEIPIKSTIFTVNINNKENELQRLVAFED